MRQNNDMSISSNASTPLTSIDMSCIVLQARNDSNGPSSGANTASRLLQLPAELRNQIYEFVLGGQLIHIRCRDDLDLPFSKPILSRQLCIAKETELEAYKKFKVSDQHPGSGPPYSIGNCEDRHSTCEHELWSKLSPTILRTCRQIYREARLVPYHANTFSFTSADTLDQFVTSLIPVQKLAIRSLHLDMMFDDEYDRREYNECLKNTVVEGLPRLRDVHLCLELRFDGDLHLLKDMAENKDKWIYGLLALQMLPLQTVTVVISDAGFPDQLTHDYGAEEHAALEKEYRWTADAKKEFAEDIRRRLLKPRDEEKYQTELAHLVARLETEASQSGNPGLLPGSGTVSSAV